MKPKILLTTGILFLGSFVFAGRQYKSVKEKVKTYPTSVEASGGVTGGTAKVQLKEYKVRIIKYKGKSGSCLPSQVIM